MPQHEAHVSFTVPAGAGTYSGQRITFSSLSTTVISPPLLGVTALLEATVPSAAVELWLLSVGADPTVDANYFLFDSQTASHTWALASYRGAQIRVKSGGTGGTLPISATAD